ncbi:MAG: hypothetical protein RBQ84_03325 [Arcobacter sp.]|jgi:iron complex outermembrane receptor protein|uniref:TonB-dependent receptor n=1 Tax=unclassified Arcobacter TaxID=2593671 RepID=UPI000229615D|nr:MULTISPECIES: TonB-dependent receptor [unclassified Arcobacter]MDY3199959.1 hypothetical protein [Arcobacter sp.]BAK73989.1 TonB-dependent receptor [Arcobacter sp. L]
MKIKSYSLILMGLLCSSSFADETKNIQLELIEIKDSLENYFFNLDENTQTKTISGDAAAVLQGTSSSNYFKSLQLLPSVNIETQDAYALTVDQNMLRVRGQLGDTFSKLSTTIEGIPFGVNVGNGGTGLLVDKENLSSLDFTTGLTPSNKGFGLGTTSGALDLKIVKPKDDFGGMLSIAGGSDHYKKAFLRLDSGKINDKVGFFISASDMENDKWKGEGEIKRKNLNAMTTIDVTDETQIELFGAYNTFDRHEYKPLTYDETKSLSSNYSKDYNSTLSGVAKTDAMYYDYNKQDFDEYFYYIALNTHANDLKIRLKPYTFGSEGTRYIGNATNGTVTKMTIEQEAYGANLDLDYPLAGGKLYGGWWYQQMESTPPPKIQKVYSIQSDGSLKFKSYGMLTDIDDRTSNSPYIGYDKTVNNTYFNVGLRYMMFDFPAVTGYNTTGMTTDLSYDEAIAASSGIKSGMKVDESSSDVLLPSLVIEQKLNPNWKVGGGYAKNFANPWQGPLWSVYNSNTSKFQAAGITLQDLWDELKLETSNNFELFAKYSYENFLLKNTLFYGDYKNKQVTVYDPNLDLSYYKSDSNATSMGAEIEGSYNLNQTATLFASTYYNKFEFDDDILLATNTYLKSKGNQIPDVAKFGAKLGVNLDFDKFSVTPIARYIGKRYGDAENTEKVNGYTVFDLNTKYVVQKDKVELSLALQNIFDKKYIGIVKNSLDDTRTGATDYYQGAPFSAVFSMIVKF